jgi:ribonucleoside-diphosphate reductase alpha chain
MGLRYGSEESIAFIHLIGSCLKNGALRASSDYAKEHGTFNMYDDDYIQKSRYIKKAPDGVKDMIHFNGLANGTLLSIAPTGTISTMCGHTGGVEPIYQVAYERTTHTLQNEGSGQTFKIYAKSVWDLLKHDGIDPDSVSIDEIKAKYPYVVDTYDIDPIDRVRVQATLQEYVDNAISSTINMKHDSTVEDVENVYLEAWKQGCKGITIFRDGCKRFSILGKDKPEKSVETKPETVEKVADETKLDCLEPHKRGNIHSLWGKTFVYKTACVRKFYVTVNCMDNDIFEVFVGADTGCQANINTITRLTSYALRLGGKVDDIIKELNSAICPACSHLIRNGNKEYNKSCASCIADALKEMQSIIKDNGKAEGHMMFMNRLSARVLETITPEPLSEVNLDTTKHNDMFECPECHQKTLKPEGKCATCSNCGYSKCG